MRQYLLDTPTTTALLYRRPPVVALVDPWREQHTARRLFLQVQARTLVLRAPDMPYEPWVESHYRPGRRLE